jgi:hypothetical protein
LDDLDDVRFKLLEVSLYTYKVVFVVILFHDLLSESVVNSSLNNIWIFVCVRSPTAGLETRSLLPK